MLFRSNRLAHCWNLSPVKALARAAQKFGPTIHIEAGVSIISELLAAGAIDTLELSITPITGGEDKIDLEELLHHFDNIHEEIREGVRFISAQAKPAP